jgi:cytochrome P450
VPYGFPGEGKPVEDVVLVASKALAMTIFDDPDGLYSMSGQKARMGQSFGEIFLGLDSGDGYEEVADKVNPAIMAMPEADAFALTYKIGRAILDKTFGAFSVLFDERRGDLDLRRDYVTPILEWVCAAWFGIPDQKEVALPGKWDGCDPHHVDAGGWSWQRPAERKPRCPGDFMATSRYCFYPDPAPAVQAYGQEQGQALRAAVTEHFRDLRRYGKTPHAPVAQLMAEVFPDDDEAARTLIGVMTGFLPPTEATIRWTLYDWLEERTLWRHDRARAALLAPLMRSMQKRPQPDMLWRTARDDHVLGPVTVKQGDRIFIGIVSAMAEDVANGVTEVYPVFGGHRGKDPHPVHACPAYNAAMGVMLGALAALLDAARVETLPGPLLVRLSDLAGAPAAPGSPPGTPPAECPVRHSPA